MSCSQCGCPTSRRTCVTCARMDRAEEAAEHDEYEWAECPDCGGITSGEGITCADCRREGAA